jgi:hypothetical protein
MAEIPWSKFFQFRVGRVIFQIYNALLLNGPEIYTAVSNTQDKLRQRGCHHPMSGKSEKITCITSQVFINPATKKQRTANISSSEFINAN